MCRPDCIPPCALPASLPSRTAPATALDIADRTSCCTDTHTHTHTQHRGTIGDSNHTTADSEHPSRAADRGLPLAPRVRALPCRRALAPPHRFSEMIQIDMIEFEQIRAAEATQRGHGAAAKSAGLCGSVAGVAGVARSPRSVGESRQVPSSSSALFLAPLLVGVVVRVASSVVSAVSPRASLRLDLPLSFSFAG